MDSLANSTLYLPIFQRLRGRGNKAVAVNGQTDRKPTATRKVMCIMPPRQHCSSRAADGRMAIPFSLFKSRVPSRPSFSYFLLLRNEKNREVISGVPIFTLKMFRWPTTNAAHRIMESSFHQTPRMTSLFFSLPSLWHGCPFEELYSTCLLYSILG